MEVKNSISLTEVSSIVDAVVDVVVMEVDGKVTYKPEYLKVASDFYKVVYFAPDTIDKVDIFEFYSKVQNGDYFDVLNDIGRNAQCKEIDEMIERKVAFRLSQITNPVMVALAEIVNTINSVIIKNEDRFTDIDMSKFADSISSMSEKFDIEKVIDAVTKKSAKKKTKAINIAK